MKLRRGCRVQRVGLSAFAGFRFPPEVIMVTVRWYSATTFPIVISKNSSPNEASALITSPSTGEFNASKPLLIDAARPCRLTVGRRWFVDETYVKVAGVWRYVYRAVDDEGQIIDVFVSPKRDIAAATKFFS